MPSCKIGFAERQTDFAERQISQENRREVTLTY